MASRFLLRGGALSARGYRLLAGQMGTPPLIGATSIALAGQGLRHHSTPPCRPRSSIAELDEAMRTLERRLDALEADRCQDNSKETPATKSSSRRWMPPEAGWVKINVDALFAADFGEATTGVVIRDERGEVVLSAMQELPSFVKLLPACSSKEEALLAACKNGLELALEHAETERVILESDSAACVDALTRTCSDDHSRLPVINQEIMELKEEFDELRVAKIKRRQNVVAHLLAVQARSSGCNVCFRNVPKGCIQDQVLADRSPTPDD